MDLQKHKIDILDCTIRDGSYVVNFDWPLEKVVGIVHDLAFNNCRYIEIGHGLGLGAERTYPHGSVPDEHSLKEAVKVKRDSLLGSFFIPGIGTMEDIDRFKENGGDFLRIGTNISESGKAEAYIRHAKELGLIVSYNAMKSYVAKPFEFCRRMTEVASWGTDILYFVDSAGGLLPEEVGRYISLLYQCVGDDVKIGFHGHNNLMLANASSLAAVENGASLIDTSLLGIGRGAGNAQTETMLLILKKKGYDIPIPPIPMLKIAEKYVKTTNVAVKGIDHADVIMGYALFHSSYYALLQKIAEEAHVDPDDLMIEVAKINRENPDEGLMRMVAKHISAHNSVKIFFPKFNHKTIR